MISAGGVRFVYDEPAAEVVLDGRRTLVLGDLHIGTERKFISRGIRLYTASEAMGARVVSIAERMGARAIIILGDVKESVLHPEAAEAGEVRRFFRGLEGYDVTVTAGNHDARLGEIVGAKIVDEVVSGRFSFMHGHRWPSEEAMQAGTIFVGHNHAAVSMTDSNGARYAQKAWLVAGIDSKEAQARYAKPNPKARLVVMPAFNDLIVGMPVNEVKGDNLSPLFRNGVFDYWGAKVYSMRGELLGTAEGLAKRYGGSSAT